MKNWKLQPGVGQGDSMLGSSSVMMRGVAGSIAGVAVVQKW